VRDDRGSTLPLVLLCFLLALLLVAGTVTASSAFLAQRDLQSDCDGAAVAAAGAVDPRAVYGGGPGGLPGELPVADAAAQAAVDRYAARAGLAGTSFAVTVSADAAEVGVACGRTVEVPFGAAFGLGDGLDRTAGSRARSLVRP
jgi:hypothetical protein